MLQLFSKHLEEINNQRIREWEAAEKALAEAEALDANASELDSFLEELGVVNEGEKNAYYDLGNKRREEVRRTYSVTVSEEIDNTLKRIKSKASAPVETIERLIHYLQNNVGEMDIQAAFVLVAQAECNMIGGTYKECLQYKEVLNKAFSKLLTKDKYKDIVYAQWGSIIYEIFLNKAIEEDNRVAYMQEYFDAYAKFEQVEKTMAEIELYSDFSKSESEVEIDLLRLTKVHRYQNPLEILSVLLSQNSGIKRPIIKHYRTMVLRKAVVQMAENEVALGDYDNRIKKATDSFSKDVSTILKEYNEIRERVKHNGYIACVKKHIENKDYLEQIPSKYSDINLSKFIESYERYLLDDGWENNKDTFLDSNSITIPKRVTAEYMKAYDERFEAQYKEEFQKKIAKEYERKINNILNEVTVVPNYASKDLDLKTYRERIRMICMARTNQVCTDAYEKGWTNGIPDGEISKCLKQAKIQFQGKSIGYISEGWLEAHEYKFPVISMIVSCILGMNAVFFGKNVWLSIVTTTIVLFIMARYYVSPLLKEKKKKKVAKKYLFKHCIFQISLTTIWMLIAACLLRDFSGVALGMLYNIANCLAYALGMLFTKNG